MASSEEIKLIIRSEMDRAISDLGKLGKGLGDTEKKTKGLFSSFTDLASGFNMGSAAISKAVGYILEAVKASSNLEEQTAKFNTVFLSSTYNINQAVKDLTASYAMSTREARQYLASVQDLLVPMGMAPNAAAKLSDEVTKLAADLGSFNNLGTEKVMADIQSALVGNFETMKKYGVVLNETVIKEKARSMGLMQGNAALDTITKTQVAYKLMIEGTEAAQGDMIRTSDSYANQLKKLKANQEDFLAAFGKPFMDALKDGMTSLDMTSDKATALGESFGVAASLMIRVGGLIGGALVWPMTNYANTHKHVQGQINGTNNSLMDFSRIAIKSSEDFIQASWGLKDVFKNLRSEILNTTLMIANEFTKQNTAADESSRKYIANKANEKMKLSEFYLASGMSREAELAKIDEYYIELSKKNSLSYEQQLMLHTEYNNKKKEVDLKYNEAYKSLLENSKQAFSSAMASFDAANKNAIKQMLFGKLSWNSWYKAMKEMLKNLIADLVYALMKAVAIQLIVGATTGGSGNLLMRLFEKGTVPSFQKGTVPAFPQGRVPDDHFAAYIGRHEAVINKESTNANRSLLKSMNDNPGQSVSGGQSVTLNIHNLYATDEVPQNMAEAIDRALFKLKRNGNSMAI